MEQKLHHLHYLNLYNATTTTHPFNGPLSGTTQVSQYQKGKTNLDLLEQEIVSGSGIYNATTSVKY